MGLYYSKNASRANLVFANLKWRHFFATLIIFQLKNSKNHASSDKKWCHFDSCKHFDALTFKETEEQVHKSFKMAVKYILVHPIKKKAQKKLSPSLFSKCDEF